MKLLILLLCLLLCGCTAEQAAPLPEAEAPADPDELYLYLSGSRHLAIDGEGHVVLETDRGQMSILYNDEGAPAAICVAMQEGAVTDEYGWTQPQTQWCDLYDPSGTFLYSIPVTYANLFDGLILGYNAELNRSQLYRYSDGALLYDNVYAHYNLGDYHYVNQSAWESPGFFLDGEGNFLSALPDGFSHGGSVLNSYLVVCQNGLYGLMAPDGSLRLPCAYEELRSGHMGCVYAKASGSWSAIDADSGETVFTWPHEIRMLLPHGAVVALDEQSRDYRLIDKDGTVVMDHRLGWVDEHDEDGDGEPELLTASVNDYTAFLCFRPDGTEVFLQDTEDGNVFLVSSHLALSHQYLWEGDTMTGCTVTMVDLDTGARTLLADSESAYASNFYSMNGQQADCFYVCQLNEAGWNRATVYDADGSILLQQLQDPYYRGGGVLQCQRGFTSGLLRLDGTWLYKESSFSTLEDS